LVTSIVWHVLPYFANRDMLRIRLISVLGEIFTA
jgi:hypothetical protein